MNQFYWQLNLIRSKTFAWSVAVVFVAALNSSACGVKKLTAPNQALDAKGTPFPSASVDHNSSLGSSSPSPVLGDTALPLLSILPSTPFVEVGGKLQLRSVFAAPNGLPLDVSSTSTWKANDETIVSINSAGLASGIAAGKSNIDVAYNSATTTLSFEVKNVKLKALEIEPTQALLIKDQRQSFKAFAVYDDGSKRDVTGVSAWDSQMSAVLSYTGHDASAGQFLAFGTGESKITATYNGQTISADVSVNNAEIASLEITPASISIKSGQVRDLSVSALTKENDKLDFTETVVWTSSNSGVVSVDNTLGTRGVIVGVQAGSADISVKFAGFTETITVTVLPIELAPAVTPLPSATLIIPAIQSPSVVFTPTPTPMPTPMPSPTQIALPSQTPTAPPTPAAPVVTGLSMTGSSFTLSPGGVSSLGLVATYSNGNQKAVYSEPQCSSSNPSAVTVSNGSLTGVAAGFATIYCVYSGYAANGTATVTAPPPSTYSLYLSSISSGGVVTGSGTALNCPTANCSVQVIAGTGTTLVATAASGYFFRGWGGACSGTGACYVVINSDTAITASFEPQAVQQPTTYTFAVESRGGGTIVSNPAGINCTSTATVNASNTSPGCTASFAANTAVTLSSTAISGKAFMGYSGTDCNGLSTCQVSMTANRSTMGLFQTAVTIQTTAPVYRLIISTSGAVGNISSADGKIACGPSLGSKCVADYPAGAVIGLTATAISGFKFNGWTNFPSAGTGGLMYTMGSSNATVNAIFVAFATAY